MGGQQSRGDNAEGAREQKEKKTKKYEAPAPTRVGRKKKKARQPRHPSLQPNRFALLAALRPISAAAATEVWPFNDKPHAQRGAGVQVQVALAQTGARQGLPAHGGGVCCSARAGAPLRRCHSL